MRPYPGVDAPTLLARGIHVGDGESEGSVLFVFPRTYRGQFGLEWIVSTGLNLGRQLAKSAGYYTCPSYG